jgi:protocatechuate 3,4-dioxygenase beta subunit
LPKGREEIQRNFLCLRRVLTGGTASLWRNKMLINKKLPPVALLLTSLISFAGLAQTAATATITGRIRIEDKPARGIVVALMNSRVNQPQRPQGNTAASDAASRAVTDDSGQYRLTNVVAGQYRVVPLAPGFIPSGANSSTSQPISVTDGANLENIDFTLTRGGVITGRVTGRGNRPMIGERLAISQIDATGKRTQFVSAEALSFSTDDRGVYRAYGLPAGKYSISVGRDDRAMRATGFAPGGNSSRLYQRTWHPDVIDESQAAVIEVEAGKEVTGVDIRMAARESYVASGRVVDAETGRPVAGVLIAHRQSAGGRNGATGNGPGGGRFQMMMPGTPDATTGAEGEFTIRGLSPGQYSAYVVQDANAGTGELYSEPVSFEILSQDFNGIELRLQRAASISGAVVFDGPVDPTIALRLSTLTINAFVRGSRTGGAGNLSSPIAPTGLFRIGGLAPGRVNLNIIDPEAGGPFSRFRVMRIERDGVDLASGLEVASGENVANVRVIMAYGNSTVRGVVRVEGGTLTPDLRLIAMARRTDNNAGGGIPPAQVDANGRFQLEGLVAGTYEITVMSMGTGRPGGTGGQRQQGGNASATQTVIVGSNAAQDVMVMLNLAAVPAQTGNQNSDPNAGNSNRRRRP